MVVAWWRQATLVEKGGKDGSADLNDPPGGEQLARVVKVTGLQVQAQGPTGATILVTTDGALSDYESFALPDPPRLVIDLPHARHAIPHPVILPAGSPILKVRTTQYREGLVPLVRLVFDLSQVLPFRTERIENGLQILLGEAPQKPASPPALAEAPRKEEAPKAQPPTPSRKAPSPTLAKRPKPERKRPPTKESARMAEMPAPPVPPAQQQPLPAPEPPRIPSTSGRLSLDFKDADLEHLLRVISEVSGLNLATADSVRNIKDRRVTIRLINVEWRQALDIILRAKDLSYEQDGNLIYVGSKSEIQKAKEDRAKDIQEAELKTLKIEEQKVKVEEERRKAEEARREGAELAKIEEQKAKAELVKEGGNRVSLDVKDRDLDDLLRLISKVSGLNMVSAHNLKDAKVTIRLINVEWRQALDLILRTKGLSYEQDGNVIYVGSKSEIQKAKEDRAKDIQEAAIKDLRIEEEKRRVEEAKRKSEEERRRAEEARKRAEEEERRYAQEPQCTKLIQLAYTKASEVKKHLDPLKSRRGSVELDERTNTVIVNDVQSVCLKMAAIAKELDAPPKDPFVTKLIPFNYAKAAELRINLAALKTPQGTVVVDERSSRVVIKDLPPAVEKMETLLKQIDIPTPQVLIEARIVEASRSFSQSLGVQWGGAGVPTSPGRSTGVTAFGGSNSPGSIQFPNPTGSSPTPPFFDPANPIPFLGPVPLALNLPAIASGANPFILGATIGSLANRYLIGLQLSAAEREGRIRTLSSPRVATQDNEEAEIKQGTQVPFTTIDSSGRTVVSFQDAFIKLKVKPHITPDGRVSMKVEAERSFAGDRIDFSGGFAFPINTRKATTNILVPNGSTVVIGGLLQSTEQVAVDQVPFMGRIPILGWLFKRQSLGPDERVELLIFLTPSVIQESRL